MGAVMGVFSELDMDRQRLEAVRIAMEDCEPGTPQQLVGERIHRLVEEMIDVSMLALDPEQKPLVQREARGIAQILLRAQLMLSVFNGEDIEQIRRLIGALEYTKKPVGLKVVRNNG
ncbi:hypothetical protein IVB27_32310 [Bradyrhizobium sp. 197]|uniref:hypothetical protein n=1 Tax=Bradyrhizobium sp. 197 TaxID=2782663 RepID=UPI001FFA7CBA|nr:hypothetical protein [Bradyrhizobium sp. 197]MCK1479298.1 hypothetical protein [Bradyrhizobium sp. 197]